MMYSALVHLPVPFEFSTPTSVVANSLIFHFEQLYGHRNLNSGVCGCPCHCGKCKRLVWSIFVQDLSHIQSFLMAKFSASSTQIYAMSIELLAAQKHISAASASGCFALSESVASAELSAAARERISAVAVNNGFTAADSVVRVSLLHPVTFLTRVPQSSQYLIFTNNFMLCVIVCVSLALVFTLANRAFRVRCL
jgi:hypothetical protein